VQGEKEISLPPGFFVNGVRIPSQNSKLELGTKLKKCTVLYTPQPDLRSRACVVVIIFYMATTKSDDQCVFLGVMEIPSKQMQVGEQFEEGCRYSLNKKHRETITADIGSSESYPTMVMASRTQPPRRHLVCQQRGLVVVGRAHKRGEPMRVSDDGG
jgi:hypothetical protein